ncbi:MAG: dihydroorotate dehydrogenase electron transfer subunit [Planctomycetota bacterium]
MLETHGVVTKNVRIGADAFFMELDCPDVAALSLPGQFLMVKCAEGLEPLTGRPFSIADVVGDRLHLGYLVVGKGTGLLAQMTEGTRVGILGPLGKPFDYRGVADRHVMVAGGIGSAPFPLLARGIAEDAPDAERTVLLGGRSQDHLYFADRFEQLGCTVRAATDDGSAGHHGFVTDLMAEYVGEPGVKFYGCGPTPMFLAMERTLGDADNPCEISVEPIMSCGFGACYGCVVPVRKDDDPSGEEWEYVKSCKEGPTFDIRDLVLTKMGGH